MIPAYTDGINLPPGGHRCSIEELEARFGQGDRRVSLFRELRGLLKRATDCGFLWAAIGGSFATSKPEPDDLDITWFTAPGVTKDTVRPECHQLMDDARASRELGHNMLYIPLDPDDPGKMDTFIMQMGFDLKTRTDRGMLVVSLS
jgi:hypothetical protein